MSNPMKTAVDLDAVARQLRLHLAGPGMNRGLYDEAYDAIEQLRRELEIRDTSVAETSRSLAACISQRDALSKENDFLRAVTGNSDKACVYCGLGADEQGKCASGFPGCARTDDQQLCRELGVAMERDALAARVKVLEEALKTVREIAGNAIPYGYDYCAAMDVIDAALPGVTE